MDKREGQTFFFSRKLFYSDLRLCMPRDSYLKRENCVLGTKLLKKSAQNSLKKTVKILCSDDIPSNRSQFW